MMKKYGIEPMKAALPELRGEIFDPAKEPFCAVHPYAPIDSFAWDENGYKPEARAYAAWDGNGFHALLCAKEEKIAIATDSFGGDVYKDSCLEWFFQPFEDDPRYINVEVNAGGAAYISFGTDRWNRTVFEAEPEGMNIRASEHDGEWWAVAYTVPNALLEQLFGRVPQPGGAMKANFYKCDESIHPHFGSWNPIVWEHPDFHRPEFFGNLELKAVSNP